MTIKTIRWGEIQVDEQDILEFPAGLPGFEDLTGFVLLDVAENPFFKWLQSIQRPEIAFLLVDPFTIKNDYYIDLNDEQMKQIGVEAPEDVLVYTTVTVPREGLRNATTNLAGPLIINTDKNKGKQIVLDSDYDIKYPLMAGFNKKNYGG